MAFTFEVKFQYFFDREKVLKSIDKAEVKLLSKAGSYVRTTARQSIRKPGKKNKKPIPGKPPFNHVGLLKDRIFFQYDPDSKSVVVGPTLLKNRGGIPAPEKLEFGLGGYNAFPFMYPALVKNSPEFPQLFSNAVK